MSAAYTVKQGDTLSAIARKHGISIWQDLYKHPDNAAFRARRPNPDLIFPGDVIMIPGETPGSAHASSSSCNILAAIDGTGSKTWISRDGSNSHVHRFYWGFQTDAKLKHYFPGPGNLGTDVNQILRDVCAFLQGAMAAAPGGPVSMVGYSRGALLAILAAQQLTVPIRFLGLYDAVDRYPDFKSGATIPGNVKVVYHAIRDDSVHSRVYFGHTGRHHDPKVDYHELPFRATHSGMGGDPDGGACEGTDDNRLIVAAGAAGDVIAGPLGAAVAARAAAREVTVTIDLATDKAESQRADLFVRGGAKKEGLPVA
jgi:hypothetical protein